MTARPYDDVQAPVGADTQHALQDPELMATYQVGLDSPSRAFGIAHGRCEETSGAAPPSGAQPDSSSGGAFRSIPLTGSQAEASVGQRRQSPSGRSLTFLVGTGLSANERVNRGRKAPLCTGICRRRNEMGGTDGERRGPGVEKRQGGHTWAPGMEGDGGNGVEKQPGT